MAPLWGLRFQIRGDKLAATVWPTREVRGDLLHQCSPLLPSIPDSDIKNQLAFTMRHTARTFLTTQSLVGLWLPGSDLEGPPLLTTGLWAPGAPYASRILLFQIRNTACVKAGCAHQGHSWEQTVEISLLITAPSVQAAAIRDSCSC